MDTRESFVEREYREEGYFSFTSKRQIQDTADVAYIFKQLENYAIENSFGVLIKDKRLQAVLHLGMGDINRTVIDDAALIYSAHKYDSDEVYFVHNHPSGNLKCSTMDIDALIRLKEALGEERMKGGIIINTTSGKALYYNYSRRKYELDISQARDEPVISTLSFSKQVFRPDYKPSNIIRSELDVASFLSSHRCGSREKINFLVMGHNMCIHANIFTHFTSSTPEDAIAQKIVYDTIRHSGNNAIIYGDFPDLRNSKIISKVKEYSADTVHIQDILQFDGLYTQSQGEKKNIKVRKSLHHSL